MSAYSALCAIIMIGFVLKVLLEAWESLRWDKEQAELVRKAAERREAESIKSIDTMHKLKVKLKNIESHMRTKI